MGQLSVRRADFMMLLAYASDLATGHSRDFALRSCVLGMRIADLAGMDAPLRRSGYHLALLRYVGCNADTHVLSATFGDEIALRRQLVGLDMSDRAALGKIFERAFEQLHGDLEPEARAKAIEAARAEAMPVSRAVLTAHCEVAQRIGARIGLEEDIRRNLGQLYERFDGKGLPHGLSGDAVLPAVGLISLAQDAIALSDSVGLTRMAEIVASRADGPYPGDLARLVSSNAARLLEGIADTVDRETILALEPDPPVMLDEAACDEAFLAIADMIDMRMPFTQGHARAVSELAHAAGSAMRLPASEVRALRWAGLIHDLGELVVPVGTWMRSGPLSARERDDARLHAYYGERALACFGPTGDAMAALVVRHHERLDGSGYHRRVNGTDLSPAARILAAAEAFQTWREERPHRKAMTSASAAERLRAEGRAGLFHADAVDAVLSAAGQASRRTAPKALAGITPREIEVLRLIASGRTAKEVAQQLGISPKTADHHIQGIYGKIGVTTRAAAALWAVEQGLLRAGEPV